MCKLIFELAENLGNIEFSDIKYKLQNIVEPETGYTIGYEILIDGANLSETEKSNIYNKQIKHPNAVRSLLNTIQLAIENNKQLPKMLENKKLFINLERSNLCDYFLLSELKAFSNLLKEQSTELIIEITERNSCQSCKRLSDGLLLLNVLDIPLAADDYDIYTSDFREHEYKSGVYDYIKIRVPKTCQEKRKLAQFFDSIENEKVIIENVETDDQYQFAKSLTPFALQGFHFGDETQFA
ncbi:diguanylate phosphodiesterase [Vibrio sp. RC586]|uniref:EAL domain-containing protein n=1 Tax=Vibrio sp. RC586 TaxID=675815 RepID=UPI0001BB83E0|nr:EAL domain-containing protein [Vibrio sp. RC586]EEZ00029.1 diguanylate phosphodiesterase [Vibrio sp. RC586]